MTYPVDSTTRGNRKENSTFRYLRQASLTLFTIALASIVGIAGWGKPSSPTVISVAAPTAGTLVGPVYVPPLGVAFTSAGLNPGTGSGNPWWFTNTGLAASDTTYWGPKPNLVFLGFCGGLGSAMTFSAAESNLPGGVLVWRGSTCFSVITRFTLKIHSASSVGGAAGAAIALTSPASLGLDPSVGGLVPVTSTSMIWRADLFFEASTDGGVNFSAAMPVFDGFHASQQLPYSAFQSFDAAFWYVNSPPTASTIATQTTPTNTATAAIPFTIGDFEMTANLLGLSATSDNQAVVPDGNITLGGGGGSRTVIITPVAGQNGNAGITLHVSDGTNTTNSSFVLGVGNTISGTVNYGVGAVPKVVPHTNLTATGSPGASTVTDLSGAYMLTGLGSGAYTVTPSKTGNINGISSADALLALRESASGGTLLSANQKIAADTSGNIAVTSADALQILRFSAAGGPTAATGGAGNWVFNPTSRTYASLPSSLTSQNFDGILKGEVNGNWAVPTSFAQPIEEDESVDNIPGVTVILPTQSVQPAGNALGATRTDRPSAITPQTISIPVGLTAPAGSTLVVPVTLNNPGGNTISNYDFSVLFDPSVLTPASPAINTAGFPGPNPPAAPATLSAGTTAAGDTSVAGRLGVSVVAFPTPVSGTGTLIYLVFTVNPAAAVGATTTLNFDTVGNLFEFDDDATGNPIPTTPTNGSFTVASTTAANVTISGRVLASNGAGLRNARVTMTDAAGHVHTALTSAFGRYSFASVPSGASYVLGVQAKSYSYQPRVVTVVDSVADLDFSPQ